jgi:GNAT superfamily N-acetyltransferase
MRVIPIPGLQHLPFAEVWFHEVDDARFREASEQARALDKTGLEVWTTTRAPAVTTFFAGRGYEEVRRYVISELDVSSAADPGEPQFELTTFADHPELAPSLFALAQVAYADQPGRSESVIGEAWYEWGLRAHPADAYFIALEGGELLGYGYLELDEGQWTHGFMAVVPRARGRGVAGAIKRAQITWAKARGIETLQTATETRLVSMLALNRRLGYRPLYEEIVLRGPLA